MKKSHAKKLHHNDEVLLKKSFDGQNRFVSVCGNPKETQGVVFIDLLDSNNNLIKSVPHKFLQ